jgi:phosphonate transport system ATP-binding protein
MPVFELEGRHARYNGSNVLHDITLKIEAGERVALVGQSGSGKSTLLRLLHAQRAGTAALVPQEFALVRVLSVFHNVYMGRLHRHASWYNLANLAWPMRREIAPVRGVLARLGLEDKIFTAVGELSGGQQQRTAVARAIHRASQIMLADEPVSAVDEHQSRAILESLNDTHSTVVLAMHDVALALAYTDRIIGLRNGRVVLDQPSAGMKPSDLDHLYVRDGA